MKTKHVPRIAVSTSPHNSAKSGTLEAFYCSRATVMSPISHVAFSSEITCYLHAGTCSNVPIIIFEQNVLYNASADVNKYVS